MKLSNRVCIRLTFSFFGILFGVSGGFQPAFAATVKAFDTTVSIHARQMNIGAFLDTLFSQIDVPVVVTDKIASAGTVNGEFNKPAAEVFQDIAESFRLALYYDGALAHVYSISDVSSSILQIPQKAAVQVIDYAEKQNMVDSRNTLVRSAPGLTVTGVPRFVVQVKELANSLKSINANSEAAFITQSFKLKYRSAVDIRGITGQADTIPGIATLLRGLYGSSSQSGLTESRNKSTLPGTIDALVDDAPSKHAMIIADPMNNAVVIHDRADHMPIYKQMIRELDVELDGITIEAIIVDLNTDRMRELGTVSQLHQDLKEGNLTKVLEDGAEFISHIDSLRSKGAASIASKQKISTVSGTQAQIDAGMETRLWQTNDGHKFPIKAGTTLQITPRVIEENNTKRFNLIVDVEDGVFTGQRIDQIPLIHSSSIRTQAVINEGESLIIRGTKRDANVERLILLTPEFLPEKG